ncbi:MULTISPECIES: NAD(P)-binding domain-containing protein [unclassified Aeromonas]|uniref:NAD(P)-dependent oxidoreductase n=1 Tax=unclassified Aeromonas TaxID=257493 RepID=UPI00084B9FA1|nr:MULTISPECIES: NAD(P)-binding domain-containing protein [unclassified Aeromonas]OEC57307.1 6-phosphogluconate dehydrogenase [Aeromonas sp. ANNP30]OEC66258.1 6-phosphogluconate dehydrogenase [Aeromonas sp. ANP5]
MRHLSVIGLGAMGSALATTLLKAGHPVTVWNRSAAKAAPLQVLGATLAPSVGAAIAASDITLVCVDNYAVSQQLLDEASDAVAGKLLVQLSTGSPQGARALESWSHARGARYLDGAILCFPDQIGTTDASIICSGASAAFSDAEPVLRLLAPTLDHVAEAVGAAAAQDCAVAAYFAGALHGALICEAEGLPVAKVCAQFSELSPILGGDVAHLGKTLASGDFDHPYASLKTWSAAISRLAGHASDAGIDSRFPRFAANLFEEGVAQGFGQQEVSALIKVLRARNGAAQ